MNSVLEDHFRNNDLSEIVDNYAVEDVVNGLDFKNVVKLAWRMLFDDYDNYQQSEFGVNLLFSLRQNEPGIWNSDWRFDALLGVACENTYRYDERYNAFKRGYDNAEKMEGDNHPGLLVSLAGCHDAPGLPRISVDDAIALVKRVMTKKMYLDGAWELSSLYHTKGDQEDHKKWKSIAQTLKSENAESSPHFYPKFLWDEEISSK